MTAAPLLAKFLHVRRSELDRTLQVVGFAILLGWAMYSVQRLRHLLHRPRARAAQLLEKIASVQQT